MCFKLVKTYKLDYATYMSLKSISYPYVTNNMYEVSSKCVEGLKRCMHMFS
jgi:hypothetical protein